MRQSFFAVVITNITIMDAASGVRKPNSNYFSRVHFRINILEKSINLFYIPSYGLNSRVAWGL